ncbi:MAG: FGGY family carbohydrate kinase [Armatimonadetes bacterium]|nr:FGGY family carbohydrate kinase [Armatimonadota bacterium]
MRPCILALDLGTTAFKAGPVASGRLAAPPVVAPYRLDHRPDGAVQCDPALYARTALAALAGAAASAREAGLEPRAVAVTSQAQTFVPMEADGTPAGPAVVWTDARAVPEAAEAAAALPDFAASAGFTEPSPLQFLCKVARMARADGPAERYLLLNEWIIQALTGQAYGDDVNQGMGGFTDIRARSWNPAALAFAGIHEGQLAPCGPAAALSEPLLAAVARQLGVGRIPVYSCGNDQSCAAIGAGALDEGAGFLNFGTAMVAYRTLTAPAAPAEAWQIAGISPLPGRWFLLGVESEFGNMVEWLAELLWPAEGVGAMLEACAVGAAWPGAPDFVPTGGGRCSLRGAGPGTDRLGMGRAALAYYLGRVRAMAGALWPLGLPARLTAAGGMSRSDAWLGLVQAELGIRPHRADAEHSGLIGAAGVVEAVRPVS